MQHAWLADLIRQAHSSSRGTYGARRVHAELTLSHGMVVGHGAVELLMGPSKVANFPSIACEPLLRTWNE